MHFLVSLLLFVAPPALASEQLCELLDYELEQAVAFELITEEQRSEIYIRCLVNYSWTASCRLPAAFFNSVL